MDQLREQLLDAFRQQMAIRRSLMELENSSMEIQMDTSKHLVTITESVCLRGTIASPSPVITQQLRDQSPPFCCASSWEQEQSRRRRKWRAERRKESFSKDESEKDSDSPESPPDSSETQEVVLAREHLVTLMAEQKKIRKQKVKLVRGLFV